MIYFVQAKDTDLVKIGYSTNAEARIASIQTDCPYPLVTLAVIPGSYQDEKRIHQRFAHLRHQGEWFSMGSDLADFLNTPFESDKEDTEISVNVNLGGTVISTGVENNIQDILAAVEKSVIVLAMRRSYTKVQAAGMLGISKSLLQYKLGKFNLSDMLPVPWDDRAEVSPL